jgi:hypothetical protein
LLPITVIKKFYNLSKKKKKKKKKKNICYTDQDMILKVRLQYC